MEPSARAELSRRMVRLAAGERGEFPALFAALWPVALGLARRMLPAADADDAAQEAMLKLFRRACEFRPDGDVVTFALGIAAYECLTLRRRAWRRGTQVPPGELVAGAPSPEERVIAAELVAAAEALLTTLKHEDREVLAAALDPLDGKRAPLGATLRKRLSRALARLRAAWRERHGAD